VEHGSILPLRFITGKVTEKEMPFGVSDAAHLNIYLVVG
jgi:hypothetical protein